MSEFPYSSSSNISRRLTKWAWQERNMEYDWLVQRYLEASEVLINCQEA